MRWGRLDRRSVAIPHGIVRPAIRGRINGATTSHTNTNNTNNTTTNTNGATKSMTTSRQAARTPRPAASAATPSTSRSMRCQAVRPISWHTPLATRPARRPTHRPAAMAADAQRGIAGATANAGDG